MALITNTYSGGMNQDSSPLKYPDNSYFSMSDFRVLTDEEGGSTQSIVTNTGNRELWQVPTVRTYTAFSTFPGYANASIVLFRSETDSVTIATQTIASNNQAALLNFLATSLNNTNNFEAKIKGNQVIFHQKATDNNPLIDVQIIVSGTNVTNSLFSTRVDSNLSIIGVTTVRNILIVFTTASTNTSATPTNTRGQIWKVAYNKSLVVDDEIVYDDILNFSTANKIKAIGRFETNNIIKAYWTDGFNNFRYANVNFDQLINSPPENLSILGNIDYSTIEVEGIGSGGRFTSGVVQYAYNLYIKHGAQTKISPTSDLIYISSRSFKGDEPNTDVIRSIDITIPELDRRFTNVRVYRIFYQTEGGNPTIDIIADEEFNDLNTSNTGTYRYNFTDDGQITLGAVTTSEFVFLGGDNFVCQDITSKNDIVFAVNNTTQRVEVDYDARAYAFRSGSNELQVRDSNGILNSYMIGNGGFNSVAWDLIPESHDSINPDYWNSTTNRESKGAISTTHGFQYNSTTRGGSGKNIRYRFVRYANLDNNAGNRLLLDDFPNNDVTEARQIARLTGGPNDGPPNYNNPVLLDFRSYQKGEIYRMGIQFFFASGARSFPKWVADVKIPEHDEQIDSTTTIFDTAFSHTTGGSEVQLEPLYLRVDVNIPQSLVDMGVVGYQILKVRRREQDRTIVSQGIVSYSTRSEVTTSAGNKPRMIMPPFINNVYYDGSSGTNWAPGTFTTTNMTKFRNIVQFYSPEVSFNKTLPDVTGMTLQIIGAGRFNVNHNIEESNTSSWIRKIKEFSPATRDSGTVLNTIKRGEIVNSFTTVQVANSQKLPLDNGNFYVNYCDNADGAGNQLTGGMGGTCLLAELDQNMEPYTYNFRNVNWTLASNQGPIYANLRRNLSAQYGGASNEAKSYNTYIAASEIVNVSGVGTSTIDSTRGDTFIYYHELLRKMRSGSQTPSASGPNSTNNAEFIAYPVETPINIGMAYSTSPWKDVQEFDDLTELRVRTIAVYQANGGTGNPPQTITDQYLLNGVYNEENRTIPYTPRPIGFEPIEENDIETRYSDRKINGENIDSWTEFRPANARNVDGQYGPLTGITVLRNQVYFTQERAFGWWEVEPRVQIQGTNGRDMEIGTGSVLHRYEYHSTTNGCQNKWALYPGERSLLYVDSINNRVVMFSGEPLEISLLAGMDSFMRRTLNDPDRQFTEFMPLQGQGIVVTYDNVYKEYYITVHREVRPPNVPDASNPVIGGGSFTGTPSTPQFDRYTLRCSEAARKFTGFFSFTPALYTSHLGRTLSLNPANNALYVHGLGNMLEYYGTRHNATITYLVNPKVNGVCIFNWFEFITKSTYNTSTQTDVYDPNDFFNTVRATNDYQDSGVIMLNNEEAITRLMRQWRGPVPRDNATDSPKMRDAFY